MTQAVLDAVLAEQIRALKLPTKSRELAGVARQARWLAL